MGVEVQWTPSIPGTDISDRELIDDYPELIRLQAAMFTEDDFCVIIPVYMCIYKTKTSFK
jgi:hypothetical protein